jgi:phosphonate transport system substrate-binding protein
LFRLAILLGVSLSFLPFGAIAAEKAVVRPLLFGVLNQQSAIRTAEYWNPVLRHLTQVTGIPLQLKMGPTVEATDSMMEREELDLVFTNHNFQAKYDGKYRVLVRRAGKPSQSVVVALESSSLRSIKELDGLTVAFPSRDAFLGYAVPRLALQDAHAYVTEKFAGSQDGALAQLKAGQVHAAAVNSRFLEPYALREGLSYRILHRSEPYLEMPIVVHPRLPAGQVAALKQALLSMHDDPGAAGMLERTGCPGFEEAAETDYDNIRRFYRASER